MSNVGDGPLDREKLEKLRNDPEYRAKLEYLVEWLADGTELRRLEKLVATGKGESQAFLFPLPRQRIRMARCIAALSESRRADGLLDRNVTDVTICSDRTGANRRQKALSATNLRGL